VRLCGGPKWQPPHTIFVVAKQSLMDAVVQLSLKLRVALTFDDASTRKEAAPVLSAAIISIMTPPLLGPAVVDRGSGGNNALLFSNICSEVIGNAMLKHSHHSRHESFDTSNQRRLLQPPCTWDDCLRCFFAFPSLSLVFYVFLCEPVDVRGLASPCRKH
jgi:hypothetical protein